MNHLTRNDNISIHKIFFEVCMELVKEDTQMQHWAPEVIAGILICA